MKNISLKYKLQIILFLTLGGFILLGSISLFSEKHTMLEEKKLKLINLVEMAYSLVDAEYKDFKNGVIDEDTARNNALSVINKLRYNSLRQQEYIFIVSNTSPYPKMILYPPSSSLNNTVLDSNQYNLATKIVYGNNGDEIKLNTKENIFKMMLDVVNKNKEGFVSYLWRGNSSSSNFDEKISYIKEFKDWNFILGSGIYIDSIDKQFYKNMIKISMITLCILIIIGSILIFISRGIMNSLQTFQTGLTSFFSYINREFPSVSLININSRDEFGEMSKITNENIKKAQKSIEEDKQLIKETISVLSELEQGDLHQRLNIKVSNPALMQLKNVLNNMADKLESNINNILITLEEYSNYNYLNKVNQIGLKEHLLKLADKVNYLGDSITRMLIENKSNGLTLSDSSKVLLSNVNKLNLSSNEAAASLEETAAALEEITSNIRNNTNSIAQMSILSSNVTSSAIEGEKLANQTNLSMDEINTQVNAINEAISVIDNIAFQTNILSLNAAVEAATAGEAGKGFAVVAQEVRNLASRSSEAAHEIKQIVETATNKADEGKQIASSMIEGYKELNTNISQTINLISDIESASKEQLLGIEQINDAVNELDRQTQQNAAIASQTNDIALATDKIATIIVQDANEKEFKGKDSIKVKSIPLNNALNNQQKAIPTKPKIIEDQNKDDNWESF